MQETNWLLQHYLPHECVEFHCSFTDWEQAVCHAGLLLLRRGCIRPAYIRRMVDSIKEFGSYIVFAEGIALAHAKPFDDVVSSAMSAVGIPEGVEFPQHGGTVHLVLAVAVNNPSNHVPLFGTLAAFLSDTNAVMTAQQAANYDELLKSMGMIV